MSILSRLGIRSSAYGTTLSDAGSTLPQNSYSYFRLLETVHTVLSVCYVYDGTITNFGNPLSVANAPWTLDVSVTFQALVGVSVQSFFAYRVWKVSKSLLFPSLAWLGSAIRFGVAVSITCLLLKSGNIATYSNDDGWTVVVSLTVSLAVDFLNSAALTWYLSARKSDFQQYVF